MGDVLDLIGVTVVRDGATLLEDVTWTVREGERWVILGVRRRAGANTRRGFEQRHGALEVATCGIERSEVVGRLSVTGRKPKRRLEGLDSFIRAIGANQQYSQVGVRRRIAWVKSERLAVLALGLFRPVELVEHDSKKRVRLRVAGRRDDRLPGQHLRLREPTRVQESGYLL